MCRLRLPCMFIGLFLLLFLAACMPSIAEPVTQIGSGYPGPIPTVEEFPTEEPEPTRIEIEPTPFQTFTPRPTATVRPGPTVTPFPIPTLPPDASGSIVYIAQDGQLMELLIDSQGEEIDAPIPIPIAYDFLPILGSASANGRFLGALQPQPDWETCRFDGTAIYAENVESGEVRRLAAGINPIWSPDGSMIAFLSNADGTPKLWQIRLDGTGLRQFSPDIQPIGNFVWIGTKR